MALSFPLTAPTVKNPRDIVIRARSTVGMTASPFSHEQQTYVHQGESWELDVSLPPMKRANAAAWHAFLTALNGREGTFVMGDLVGANPRGTWSGTPLVNGSSQTGKTLNVDGVSAGATALAGDWFQLGSGSTTRLHQVVQDATANGSGQLVLEIWPRLRASPADNAPLTITSAKGIWRLASNTREWSIGLAQIYGIRFAAVEAL